MVAKILYIGEDKIKPPKISKVVDTKKGKKNNISDSVDSSSDQLSSDSNSDKSDEVEINTQNKVAMMMRSVKK